MKVFTYTIIFSICILLSGTRSFAQCNQPGAYPYSAIELCDLNPIHLPPFSFCPSPFLFNDGYYCGTITQPETWPVNQARWYKFNCYQSGDLVFEIRPDEEDDDYNWVVFDITGKNTYDVYTQPLVVSANWSYATGSTGAYFGTKAIVCGAPIPSGSAHPHPGLNAGPKIHLIAGHHYLFAVIGGSGGTLSFEYPLRPDLILPTTAVIINPNPPALFNVFSVCNGAQVKLVFNRSEKCSSLAADGSDFQITDAAGNPIPISSATARQCSVGNSFDTLSLFPATPLIAGNYTVTVKNGTDGNTISDNCDHLVAVGNHMPFTVSANPIISIDSIAKPSCRPYFIYVTFTKYLACNSINTDAGQFYVTGPSTVVPEYVDPEGCSIYNDKITLKVYFHAAIFIGGDYILHVKKGPDGISLADSECGFAVPEETQKSFHVFQPVNPDFQYDIDYTCSKNTVIYSHDGANEVNTWRWTFDTTPFQSSLQSPVVSYTNFEDKYTSLYVRNGACEDSITKKIVFANYLKAGFDVSDDVCPEEKAVFVNTTISNSTITDWKWDIGNGNIITVKDPAPQTYLPQIPADYTALPKLTVTNSFGCSQSVTKKTVVHNTCFVAVPGAFTPNGDGLNDYLYPLKAFRSADMSFNVYNHYGQLVFHGSNGAQKWDGKIKGVPQETGAYVWILKYTDTKTGEQVYKKGSTLLLR